MISQYLRVDYTCCMAFYGVQILQVASMGLVAHIVVA